MDNIIFKVKKQKNTNSFAHYCFYLLIALIPFEQLVTINGFSLLKYAGLLLFVTSISSFKFFYGSWPKDFLFYLIFLIIGFWIDLSTFSNISDNFNDLIGPILTFMLVIISYNLAINGKLFLIIKLIFLSSFILAIYELFFVSLSDNIYEILEGEDRVSVLGTDPNFTATFISLSIIFGVIVFLKLMTVPRFLKYLSIAAIPIGFLALLKTGSRGGLLALVIGLLSIIFIYNGFAKKIKGLFLLAFLFFVGAFFLLKNEMYVTRIKNSIEEKDVAGRDFIWSKALVLYTESPMFGYGHKMHFVELGQATGNKVRATHNIFLGVLLSTGYLGMIFFLLFFLGVLKISWRYRKIEYGPFLFAAFVLCFISANSVNLEITKWYWILLAITLSQKNIYSKQLNSKKEQNFPKQLNNK